MLLLLPTLLLLRGAVEYDRYKLHELVASADLVVLGSITDVEDETFRLDVEQELFGKAGAPILRLTRFQDWMCAARWADYSVGQRVVLFIQSGKVMGAGDEGDMPVVEGDVLVPYQIRGMEYASLPVEDREFTCSRVSPRELGNAICRYRECFASTLELEGRLPMLRIRIAVDDETAKDYSRSSALALQLYEETLSSESFVSDRIVETPPPIALAPQISARSEGLGAPPDPNRRYVLRWDSALKAITTPGDVNGDGWSDLAVASHDGIVWILLLSASGKIQTSKRIDPEVLGIHRTWFGRSLGAVGDLDRDGVPDLAVCAPAKEKGDAGAIWIVFLRNDGTTKDAKRIEAPEGLEEFVPRQAFGRSVGSLGDLDGNGHVDLAVGIDDLYDFESERMFAAFLAGETYVPEHLLPILFLDGNAMVAHSASLRASDLKSGSSVTFADSLASVGDLNGDRLSELAIGDPFDCDGGEFRGAIWIVFLGQDGLLRAKQKISDWEGGFEASLRDGDLFGSSIASAGDLDSDGVPDLIVGGVKELWILLLRRDGTVKDFRQFGTRAGGFVPAERIWSLAVLRDGGQASRLAVSGLFGNENPLDSVIWILPIGPGARLGP